MKIFILLSFLLLAKLSASQNVWTQDTDAMSDAKAQQIIDSYLENNATLSIELEEDIPEVQSFDFRENIFTVGIEVGFTSNTEKIYNVSGEKTQTFSSTDFKFTFGKDFTLWHEEYTEPTRLYLSYEYSLLSENISYTTFTFGLRENMFYWSLYKDETYNIYPTLHAELGSSSIDRDILSSSGSTTAFGVGVALVVDDNFEYFFNINSKSIDWEHPVDGIADEMSAYSLSIGLNYKLMYGDI